MKISKKQLKRIIKEEKAKIAKESYDVGASPRDVRQAVQEIQRLRYMFEDEINSAAARYVRKWHKNETIMREISMMLDELAAQMENYRDLD